MTPRHLLAPARLAGSRLLATQSDERLVDLSRAGSEPAFEAIVSRYRGPLLRYCSALLGRERGEDAVQQTFVKAYDAMLRDERPLLLKAWLYRIAHNTAHNALRDHALRDEPLGADGAVAERPELVLEERERLRSVLASVRELPPRQRDALLLRELEGRSYEEISAALGVGGGAVRQLLNRARTTLRAAATAITPVGLLLRLPGVGSGAGESVAARVAEMTGAAGAGAVASKVAATALVTGAVAGGAALAPLGGSDGTPTPRPGAEAREEPVARGPATVAPASMGPAMAPTSADAGLGTSGARGDSSGPGSGRGGDRRGEHGGGGDGDRSGPGGGGPGGGGPGDGGDGGGSSNSGPGSGTSGSGTSGSGSFGSGSGSSDSGSGSSGSRSGSSGSGASGGGESGSASSGSGSSGLGSFDSGSSGSASSGSSPSRSGSSDPTSSGSASSDSSPSGSGSSGSRSGTSGSGHL
jgi:RNA polymerase sigma factor (sigma-70 family)